MVPCYSYHIYGIWTSRSKRFGGCLKVINQAGVPIQVTKRVDQGMNAIGKTGSHYVIMLYCKTLLHNFLGIYCKKKLLVYVLEVGKAKSASQSVLIILTLNGFLQKNFQIFYFTSENFISLTLHTFPLCLFFFHYNVCTVISDCTHSFDTSTFAHKVSQEYIAIENTT